MRANRRALDRRFEAVVFDWDGTAVPDRRADASEVRKLVEELCAAGLAVGVVSGTHVENIDGQLGARPARGHLVLALNRGSEVFVVAEDGPTLVARRESTPEEDASLDAAAALTMARLTERGLHTELVSQRLNRRKIDLIPEPEWHDPPKAQIGKLVAAVTRRLHDAGVAGLTEAVAVALQAAREAGLEDPRVTSDAKHVEIGLTDKSDSARWIFDDLWRRGIGAQDVLVAGDEFGTLGGLPGSDSLMLTAGAPAVSVGVEPEGLPDDVTTLRGGPSTFVELLRDQLARRRCRELPARHDDPIWAIGVAGVDPEHERVHEAWLTLADGAIGTSGAPCAPHPSATPWVVAAGVYDGDGPETQLVAGPIWNHVADELDDERSLLRTLDLHTGTLHEELTDAGGVWRTVRFSSLARPGTAVLRAEHRPGVSKPVEPLAAPAGTERWASGDIEGLPWLRVRASSGGIVAVASQEELHTNGRSVVDRFVAYEHDGRAIPEPRVAARRTKAAGALGFDELLGEHRAAWAARWADGDVVIEGDDDLQHATRFALFHLMSTAADVGEAAVGARGLTGPAYRGHVFWDSDVFVLPYLAATHPPAARAMLEYRVRRLPEARAAARAAGRTGARFPWESARRGNDVTPESARDRSGRLIAIRTGQLEEHIVADVAWAASCYVDWTGDLEFASGPGAELLAETARYWASRIRVDNTGRAHILGVIGPDEYHEPVDDNAYTNVMARWNLQRAARDPSVVVDESERERWLDLARNLVDGYNPDSEVYEEFAGFFDLEPLVIAEVAPRRPIAADLLLGRERVRSAQVVKQADVLMLHHLLPDEVAPGSLQPNLQFYEPRTAHGSSLSPGIHAGLLARARDFDRALDALRIAARLDLDDLTGSTAGGLHLATCASVWHALAYGFAGIRPASDRLIIDPRLPEAWSAYELHVVFRGCRVTLRKERARARVTADAPVQIQIDETVATIGPSGSEFRRDAHGWRTER